MICFVSGSNLMFAQFDPMLILPQALSIPGPGQARANNGWALSTLVASPSAYPAKKKESVFFYFKNLRTLTVPSCTPPLR